MKIIRVETLLSRGQYATSAEWRMTRERVCEASRAVDWPPGNGKFTIYPESGRARRRGTGVKPTINSRFSERGAQAF